MDEITRARENFQRQKSVYEGMLKRKRELEELISSSQKQLRIITDKLPEQEKFYKNSKIKVESFGSQQHSDKLKQIDRLRAQIEKMSGDKIVVPILEQTKAKANEAISEANAAMAALGLPAGG